MNKDLFLNNNPLHTSRKQQLQNREPYNGLGKIAKKNSEFIFTNKQLKKNTKGYDDITGEIEKRGKPIEKDIFLKGGEEELTPAQEQKKKRTEVRSTQ